MPHLFVSIVLQSESKVDICRVIGRGMVEFKDQLVSQNLTEEEISEEETQLTLMIIFRPMELDLEETFQSLKMSNIGFISPLLEQHEEQVEKVDLLLLKPE